MNKILSLIICLVSLLYTSCRDLPQNGDFSGFWQITAIDYSDGTSLEADHDHCYGFYRTVAQLIGGYSPTEAPDMWRYGEKSGNLAYHDTDFVIEFPTFGQWWDMVPWGFPQLPEGVYLHQPVYAYYTINRLDGDILVMTLDRVTDAVATYPAGITITCRRY
ncbi:MAG: lipocalin-like domain-containing protein [Paramuribaculum sp.]|nr:lipocalin-like domain-containing protein [Paramuribaculum sp.]